MSEDKDVAGQLGRSGATSAGNQHRFQTRQILGEHRTHFVAKIVKVYNRNSLDKPCTVDIQLIVKQADGVGKSRSHGTIYGIPVPRNQAGDSVVINDPKVGDVANFSVLDRDHSSAQANDWKESNPGSFRRGWLSDAIFHGVLPRKSQEVKQYIRFEDGDSGVTIKDRHNNTLSSTKNDGWNLNGLKIDRDGNLKTPGNVIAGDGTSDRVTLQQHKHAGSPPPDPGT